MRRLLVTGSRTWTDVEQIREVLTARFVPDLILVSGHCPRGADKICEQVWAELGGRVERFPADWRKHGRKAGEVRDKRMVERGAEEAVAFIQDHRPGASATAPLAKEHGIPVSRFIPSADDYERQAGLAYQSGDLAEAARRIQRARVAHPHELDRWAKHSEQIQDAIDREADQGALFSLTSLEAAQ